MKAAGYKPLPSNAPGPGYKGSTFQSAGAARTGAGPCPLHRRGGRARGRRDRGDRAGRLRADRGRYEDLPVVADAARRRSRRARCSCTIRCRATRCFEFGYGDRSGDRSGVWRRRLTRSRSTLDAQRISGAPMEPKACRRDLRRARPTASTSTCRPRAWPTSRRRSARSPACRREHFRIHATDVGGGFGVRNEVYPENRRGAAGGEDARPPGQMGRHALGKPRQRSPGPRRGAERRRWRSMPTGNFLALRVQWLVNMGAYCSKNGPVHQHHGVADAAWRTTSTSVPALLRPAQAGVDQLPRRAPPIAARAGPTCPISGSVWSTRPRASPASTASGCAAATCCRRSAFPVQDADRLTYDSGDPPALLDAALEAADWDEFEARGGREAKRRGKLRGIGLALFIEPSGGVGKEEIAIRFERNGEIVALSRSPARAGRAMRPCSPRSSPRCSASSRHGRPCRPAIRRPEAHRHRHASARAR